MHTRSIKFKTLNYGVKIYGDFLKVLMGKMIITSNARIIHAK